MGTKVQEFNEIFNPKDLNLAKLALIAVVYC